jgi:sodium-dependent dicarboxylate transporter 2/3/5
VQGFLLAIGYAATIGGLATPVGTPTNAIFLSQFSLFFPEEPEFSFGASLCIYDFWISPGSNYVMRAGNFVLVAGPLSLMLLVVTWLGICTMYIWRAKTPIPVDLTAFSRARDALGKWTYEELVLSIDLSILIFLWFTASQWKPYVAPKLVSSASLPSACGVMCDSVSVLL